MSYVVAGYAAVLGSLSVFALSVVWRERAARARVKRPAGTRPGGAESWRDEP